MAPRILSSETLEIVREDDIVLVRRRARTLAQERGFDAFAIAAITTAASELARNAWTHGKGGHVTVDVLMNGDRAGLRLSFKDEGPGIAQLDRALAGGYSTARSLGLGLSGSRRLVDEFDIQTGPGDGTTVTVTKWTRF
jgi:serine/threonine-protein kinase RsbT